MMTKMPDEPTVAQISQVNKILSDPVVRGMAKDFHRLLAERVQGPRDRLFDLIDNPHIAALLATDDILDVGMHLMAVAMDEKTAARISKVRDGADRRETAMAEVELLLLLRGFLAGVIAVKAEAGGLGMIELGEAAARAKDACFVLNG